MKIKDQLDALACAELRLTIRTRMDFIVDVFGSPERTRALESLIHLINELGFDVEEFMND